MKKLTSRQFWLLWMLLGLVVGAICWVPVAHARTISTVPPTRTPKPTRTATAIATAAPNISLNGTQWRLDGWGGYAAGTARQPGVYFDLPTAPDLPVFAGTQPLDWRAYLVTQPRQRNFTAARAVTATLRIGTTGNPVWGYHSDASNTSTTPARVRLYVQSGDLYSMGADGTGSNRWWSRLVYADLGAGTVNTFTLTAPLTPDQWSNTGGRHGDYDAATTTAFWAVLGSADWVGMTYGGGQYYGHGVNVPPGTVATIAVLEYRID
jgi:hypothetical protein